MGRASRSVRVLHLTEVACELFELAPQLVDLAALIDDDLVQLGKRLLCMHQDTFDVGQALVGGLGQVNPLVSISAGSKFSILKFQKKLPGLQTSRPANVSRPSLQQCGRGDEPLDVFASFLSQFDQLDDCPRGQIPHRCKSILGLHSFLRYDVHLRPERIAQDIDDLIETPLESVASGLAFGGRLV